ncbi:MAG: D-glycerate dehydrogenase, partial [Spirochaetaceae bacterium]|nr:D-glycerate dehydrogenase [Spirochaetaceae bacterium]
MQRPKILITREIPSPGVDLLKKECDVEINTEDRALTRSELLSMAADKDAVLCLLTDKIDAEFFDAAPNLKGVANYAVGFDNMIVSEATSRGIPLSNTPDVLTEATAEMAWALLFSVARRIVESDLFLRTGQWQGWGPLQYVGRGISGRTLGIVGPGRIGTSMAMMSRGFNMKVLYSGNRKNKLLEDELGAEFVPFNKLVKESDFISLHVPFWADTKHMFSASVFKEMKNSAIIINTARGAVIKEDDLLDALTSGEIAGAGLDVYEFEP